MNVAYVIIVTVLIISIILAIRIPKGRRREALVAFIALQALTWLVATSLVHLGILKFPVRVFTKATRINFVFEFTTYPVVFSWFYLTYNKNASKGKRMLHYFIYISIIVWFLFLTGKYTGLVKFLELEGYKQIIRLYISFFIEFWLAKTYTIWFFKDNESKKGAML